MNIAPVQHVLRVFYRDYGNDLTIKSTAPESISSDRIGPLAEHLLASADSFLGVIDRNDTILQCYVADDPESLTLELVYPDATGCLRLTMPRQQALECLAALPDTFDESLLSGAQYIA